MKTLIIYNSQTGFTARYAAWLAEMTGAVSLPLREAKKADLAGYDVIMFGSWACAGGISQLKWFKQQAKKLTYARLAVFCTGASPSENPEQLPTLRRNFTEAELGRIALFYCPGGFAHDKMSMPSRMAIGMLIRMLSKKKDKTPEDEAKLAMISTSYDLSERKYLEPVAAWLEGQA